MTVAYTTASAVKESAQLAYDFLGFSSDATYTTFVETLIGEAEALIDGFCRVPSQFFKAGGVAITAEYHDGDGGDVLRLNYYPVLSVSSVAENEASLFEAESWVSRSAGPGASGSYVLRPESGELVFYQNVPGVGVRNVKVGYTPGYAAAPGAVAGVARDLCVNALRSLLARKVLPAEITQIAMNGGDVRELLSDTMTLSAAHKRNLSAYRRPEVSVG